MPKNRYLQGYNVVTDSGAFYFFIPPMVIFVVMLIEVVREKEYRLRHGLCMMGMSHRAYWHSWIISSLVFILIGSNSLIVSGLLCQFDFFLHTPYLILLMLFGLFTLAMIALAFMMATLLTTTKAAYTTSYAFILLGLVLQLFLSDVTILYLFYARGVPTWVVVVRYLLMLYPPFNFSKAFGDIARKSSAHYSSWEHLWVSG